MKRFEKKADHIENAQVMKVIRQYEFGGPEVLCYEDAPIPELKPREVRVRVPNLQNSHACWHPD
ncbi:hypothetical protein [Pedobacter hartonius]|uniref:Uncharacterized protein n=1 Tax=Pedobacter hartonius TaxID=425514 RepID=A0A1H4CNQ2_9SPHI|nr:hypothetical protein [Pedobacter hartonius]SEA62071.1 hypothetical protein SAMN05443550_104122 [Pedobacter hartonius]